MFSKHSQLKKSLSDVDSFADCQPSLSKLEIVKGVRSLKEASEGVNYCDKCTKSLCRGPPQDLGVEITCVHMGES